MNPFIKNLLVGTLDLIFPRLCITCKKDLSSSELGAQEDLQLCLACQTAVEENVPPFCSRCPHPWDSRQNFEDAICPNCRKFPMAFDQAWAACLYTNPMRQLIHLFKYHSKTALRHFFTLRLLHAIEAYQIPARQCDLIIPIPLHATRRRERGYNQAQLLAHELSWQLKVPHIHDALRRIRPTQPQTALKPKERWTNIQGAFKMNALCKIQNKNILLVDDLYTTGATLSEAATILKNAGARNVLAITVAVAAKDDLCGFSDTTF